MRLFEDEVDVAFKIPMGMKRALRVTRQDLLETNLKTFHYEERCLHGGKHKGRFTNTRTRINSCSGLFKRNSRANATETIDPRGRVRVAIL